VKTRRELLRSLGGLGFLGAARGLLAEAKGKVWRIGVLSSRSRPASLEQSFDGQIPAGLRDLGYVEERNVVFEWRFAGGDYERLQALATDLVRLPVDVIVTVGGTPPAVAAQKATTTIPIVFLSVGDPVGVGLAKSLARPGGNATGISVLADDTVAKQMEMLGRVVPGSTRMAFLTNLSNPSTLKQLEVLRGAAAQARKEIITLEARSPLEITKALDRLRRDRVSAVIVPPESLFVQQTKQIVEEVARLRLPSMAGWREFPEAGGLMSYGADRWDLFRRAGAYVDKIVKGTRAGEIPVEQPTKLELVLNRKTARALGIEFPAELLLLADKVIE
jgi:putative ABC transport system substrate-binding protein